MSVQVLQPPPDGDVDLRGRYMAGIIVMTIIAVLVVWLRIYTRAIVSRNLGWDDWIMLAASLISIVTDAFLINSYRLGLGRHAFYLPPENVPETFKWLWAAEPTFLFAVTLVRLSIAFFVLRLVPPSKRYIWTIWATIGMLAVSDIYISIIFFSECRPIRKLWLPTTPGTCFGGQMYQSALWLFQGVAILTDVVFLCIPVALFWRLQVDLRSKLVLIFLCGLGIFTCACTIVKIILLPNLYSTDLDKTWIVARLGLWAPLELCVGMICASIPTLRPLVSHWQRKGSRGPYHDDRTKFAMKLESPQRRSGKANRRSRAEYPSFRGINLFAPSTSAEPISGLEEEHQILKTQDVEISFNSAELPGNTSRTQGWEEV